MRESWCGRRELGENDKKKRLCMLFACNVAKGEKRNRHAAALALAPTNIMGLFPPKEN